MGHADRNSIPRASCVEYYERIRSGAPAESRSIGYGVSRLSAPPDVTRLASILYKDYLKDRFRHYDHPADHIATNVALTLYGEYIGLDLSAFQPVFTIGATEAIYLVASYLAARDISLLMPLPAYYAFDQAAALERGRIYYYCLTGAMAVAPPDNGRVALVDIIPNSVTGSIFELPATDPMLVICDHVMALPSVAGSDEAYRLLTARIRATEPDVIILSPAKDLSLPGLRAGLLLTSDPGLAEHCRLLRLSLGYAVPGAAPAIMALHAAVLLAATACESSRGLGFSALQAVPGFHDSTDILESAQQSVREHYGLAAADFCRVIELHDDADVFHPLADNARPVVGYSSFRWLSRSFASMADFTSTVREIGRRGVKLYPNEVHGGTARAWAELYPGRFGIRMNHSGSRELAIAELTILSREFGET